VATEDETAPSRRCGRPRDRRRPVRKLGDGENSTQEVEPPPNPDPPTADAGRPPAERPSNPFGEGCLRSLLGSSAFPDRRVCNSDDPDDAATRGLCDAPLFAYPEVRVANQNWDGPMITSWIMQIMLSELLRVPTTIETSSPDRHHNFYDPRGRSDAAAATYPYEALRRAKEAGGDCRTVRSENNGEAGEYKSCANVFPMVNKVGQAEAMQELYNDGVIHQPRASGNADQYRWWIPKMYARKHPSLQSIFGIAGTGNPDNRRTLAELFERPTNWSAYCDIVSPDGCETADGTAARAPEDDVEGAKYFEDGLYAGHFRATDKNNCTANPETCTGHITNVQCGWATYVVPQAYHLNISVESDGNLSPNGGYSYSSVLEIYAAANATKSNVLVYWWEPDPLIEKYRGTDFEFVPIYLPPPTKECERHRVTADERCSENLEVQVGSPLGSCDAGLVPMVTPMTLEECDRGEVSASCSPAFDALQSFELPTIDLQQIYQYRSEGDGNPDGRLSVCRWFAENLDAFKQTAVPRTYPRQPRGESFYRPLTYFSAALAAMCMIAVPVCALACKKYQRTKVMIYAQVDFLLIILAGLFLVSIAAMLHSVAPSEGVCVSRRWFVAVGYSLELIPLSVKIHAINKVVQQSMRMRRIQMERRTLYQIVGGCILAVCIYLSAWTAVDPAKPRPKMTLTNETENGKYLVEVSTYCASSSDGWQIATSVYLLVLLLVSAAIVTQSRGLREEFNETRYLALMIYSHFVFTIMRLVAFLIGDGLGWTYAKSAVMSILLSLDVLITIGIYFLPKLLAVNKDAADNRDVLATTSTAETSRGSFNWRLGLGGTRMTENGNDDEVTGNDDPNAFNEIGVQDNAERGSRVTWSAKPVEGM